MANSSLFKQFVELNPQFRNIDPALTLEAYHRDHGEGSSMSEFAQQVGYADAVAEMESPDIGYVEEGVRAVQRGSVGLVQMIPELTHFLGRNINSATGWEGLEDLSENAIEYLDAIKEDPEMRASYEAQTGDNYSARKWISVIGEGAPSLAATFVGGGIGLVAKGALGATKGLGIANAAAKAMSAKKAFGIGAQVAGSMQLTGEHSSAIREFNKLNPDHQVSAITDIVQTALYGLVGGKLETLFPAQLLSRFVPKKQAARIALEITEGLATEGITEGSQQLISNALIKYGIDPTQELTEGLLESVVAGSALGGGTAGVAAMARSGMDKMKPASTEDTTKEADEVVIESAGQPDKTDEAVGNTEGGESLDGKLNETDTTSDMEEVLGGEEDVDIDYSDPSTDPIRKYAGTFKTIDVEQYIAEIKKAATPTASAVKKALEGIELDLGELAAVRAEITRLDEAGEIEARNLLLQVIADYGQGGDSGDNEEETTDYDYNYAFFYKHAKEKIAQGQAPSASWLSRQYKIPMQDAGKMLTEMEEEGFILPAQGATPRRYMSQDEKDLADLDNIQGQTELNQQEKDDAIHPPSDFEEALTRQEEALEKKRTKDEQTAKEKYEQALNNVNTFLGGQPAEGPASGPQTGTETKPTITTEELGKSTIKQLKEQYPDVPRGKGNKASFIDKIIASQEDKAPEIFTTRKDLPQNKVKVTERRKKAQADMVELQKEIKDFTDNKPAKMNLEDKKARDKKGKALRAKAKQLSTLIDTLVGKEVDPADPTALEARRVQKIIDTFIRLADMSKWKMKGWREKVDVAYDMLTTGDVTEDMRIALVDMVLDTDEQFYALRRKIAESEHGSGPERNILSKILQDRRGHMFSEGDAEFQKALEEEHVINDEEGEVGTVDEIIAAKNEAEMRIKMLESNPRRKKGKKYKERLESWRKKLGFLESAFQEITERMKKFPILFKQHLEGGGRVVIDRQSDKERVWKQIHGTIMNAMKTGTLPDIGEYYVDSEGNIRFAKEWKDPDTGQWWYVAGSSYVDGKSYWEVTSMKDLFKKISDEWYLDVKAPVEYKLARMQKHMETAPIGVKAAIVGKAYNEFTSEDENGKTIHWWPKDMLFPWQKALVDAGRPLPNENDTIRSINTEAAKNAQMIRTKGRVKQSGRYYPKDINNSPINDSTVVGFMDTWFQIFEEAEFQIIDKSAQVSEDTNEKWREETDAQRASRESILGTDEASVAANAAAAGFTDAQIEKRDEAQEALDEELAALLEDQERERFSSFMDSNKFSAEGSDITAPGIADLDNMLDAVLAKAFTPIQETRVKAYVQLLGWSNMKKVLGFNKFPLKHQIVMAEELKHDLIQMFLTNKTAPNRAIKNLAKKWKLTPAQTKQLLLSKEQRDLLPKTSDLLKEATVGNLRVGDHPLLQYLPGSKLSDADVIRIITSNRKHRNPEVQARIDKFQAALVKRYESDLAGSSYPRIASQEFQQEVENRKQQWIKLYMRNNKSATEGTAKAQYKKANRHESDVFLTMLNRVVDADALRTMWTKDKQKEYDGSPGTGGLRSRRMSGMLPFNDFLKVLENETKAINGILNTGTTGLDQLNEYLQARLAGTENRSLGEIYGNVVEKKALSKAKDLIPESLVGAIDSVITDLRNAAATGNIDAYYGARAELDLVRRQVLNAIVGHDVEGTRDALKGARKGLAATNKEINKLRAEVKLTGHAKAAWRTTVRKLNKQIDKLLTARSLYQTAIDYHQHIQLRIDAAMHGMNSTMHDRRTKERTVKAALTINRGREKLAVEKASLEMLVDKNGAQLWESVGQERSEEGVGDGYHLKYHLDFRQANDHTKTKTLTVGINLRKGESKIERGSGVDTEQFSEKAERGRDLKRIKAEIKALEDAGIHNIADIKDKTTVPAKKMQQYNELKRLRADRDRIIQDIAEGEIKPWEETLPPLAPTEQWDAEELLWGVTRDDPMAEFEETAPGETPKIKKITSVPGVMSLLRDAARRKAEGREQYSKDETIDEAIDRLRKLRDKLQEQMIAENDELAGMPTRLAVKHDITDGSFKENGQDENAVSIAQSPPPWFTSKANAAAVAIGKALAPSTAIRKAYAASDKGHDAIIDYARSYIKDILGKLDRETVAKVLEGKQLLCFETGKQFCHRRIVMHWLNGTMPVLKKRGLPKIPTETISASKQRVAVIGTAFRKTQKVDDLKYLTKGLYDQIYETIKSKVKKNQTLVSGGAAGVDHVAVQLFLNDEVDGLVLYLPAPLMPNGGKFEGKPGKVGTYKTAGGTANYHHDNFKKKTGIDTYAELHAAIAKGAVVHALPAGADNKAMFTRNTKVAMNSDAVVAATFGNDPVGGTKDAFDKSRSDEKIHIPIKGLSVTSNKSSVQGATPVEVSSTVSTMENTKEGLSIPDMRTIKKHVGTNPKVLVASEHSDPVFHVKKIKELINSGKYAAAYFITKHDGLPLRQLLSTKIPKIVHFSITTLGGTAYEPGVMKYNDLLDRIEAFVKEGKLDPTDVTIRIDPIIPYVTNIKHVEEVIQRAAGMGIKQIRFSVMDLYGGSNDSVMTQKLRSLGYKFEAYTAGANKSFHAKPGIITDIATKMKALADKHGIESIATCAERHNVAGVEHLGCLNVNALNKVLGTTDIVDQKSKQRKDCSCYGNKSDALKYSDACASSCIYCYAKHNSREAMQYYDKDGTLKDNKFTQTAPVTSNKLTVDASITKTEKALNKLTYPEALSCDGRACFAIADRLVKELDKLGIKAEKQSVSVQQNLKGGGTKSGDHAIAMFEQGGKTYIADIPQSYMIYDNKTGTVTLAKGATPKVRIVEFDRFVELYSDSHIYFDLANGDPRYTKQFEQGMIADLAEKRGRNKKFTSRVPTIFQKQEDALVKKLQEIQSEDRAPDMSEDPFQSDEDRAPFMNVARTLGSGLTPLGVHSDMRDHYKTPDYKFGTPGGGEYYMMDGTTKRVQFPGNPTPVAFVTKATAALIRKSGIISKSKGQALLKPEGQKYGRRVVKTAEIGPDAVTITVGQESVTYPIASFTPALGLVPFEQTKQVHRALGKEITSLKDNTVIEDKAPEVRVDPELVAENVGATQANPEIVDEIQSKIDSGTTVGDLLLLWGKANLTGKHMKYLRTMLNNLFKSNLGIYLTQVKIAKQIPSKDYSSYNIKEHTIYLNSPDLYTLAHECIHALTSHFLKTKPNHIFTKQFKKIFAKFKEEAKKDGMDTLYGFQNEREFLTEAFVNPELRAYLDSKYMQVGTSIWSKIKDWIAKRFGVRATALDGILNMANSIAAAQVADPEGPGAVARYEDLAPGMKMEVLEGLHKSWIQATKGGADDVATWKAAVIANFPELEVGIDKIMESWALDQARIAAAQETAGVLRTFITRGKNWEGESRYENLSKIQQMLIDFQFGWSLAITHVNNAVAHFDEEGKKLLDDITVTAMNRAATGKRHSKDARVKRVKEALAAINMDFDKLLNKKIDFGDKKQVDIADILYLYAGTTSDSYQQVDVMHKVLQEEYGIRVPVAKDTALITAHGKDTAAYKKAYREAMITEAARHFDHASDKYGKRWFQAADILQADLSSKFNTISEALVTIGKFIVNNKDAAGENEMTAEVARAIKIIHDDFEHFTKIAGYMPMLGKDGLQLYNGLAQMTMNFDEIVSTHIKSSVKSGGFEGHTYISERGTSGYSAENLKTNIVEVWKISVEKQEHFIAYSGPVNRLREVLHTPEIGVDDRLIRNTLYNDIKIHWGTQVAEAYTEYASANANPRGHTGAKHWVDRIFQIVKKRAALSFLGANLVTMGKQIPSVIYYLKYTPYSFLIKSLAKHLSGFHRTVNTQAEWVALHSPQMKNRYMEEVLDDLEHSMDTVPKAVSDHLAKVFKITEPELQRRAMIGLMGGIKWMDKAATTIGYSAVYDYEMSKATAAEGSKAYKIAQGKAHERALQATMETQPASDVKDIGRMYRTNQVFSTFLMFTNQLNKIWGLGSHDVLYKRFVTGKMDEQQWRIAISLGMGSVIIGFMSQGWNWEDDDEDTGFVFELGDKLATGIASSIPLVGQSVSSAMHGFQSPSNVVIETPYAAYKAGQFLFKGEWEKAFWTGTRAGLIPGQVQAKRIYQAVTGDDYGWRPGKLIGRKGRDFDTADDFIPLIEKYALTRAKEESVAGYADVQQRIKQLIETKKTTTDVKKYKDATRELMAIRKEFDWKHSKMKEYIKRQMEKLDILPTERDAMFKKHAPLN